MTRCLLEIVLFRAKVPGFSLYLTIGLSWAGDHEWLLGALSGLSE